MNTRALFVATALSLALMAAVALSQEAEKELAPKPDVKALIDQLGSADFTERKAAEEEIMKLGETALPALAQAAKGHADAHVRYEAERLMHRLALAKDSGKERELSDQPVPRRPELDSIAEAERQMNELLKQLEEQGMMDWEAFEKWREHMRSRFGQDSAGVRGGVISGVSDNGRERIEYEQKSDGSQKIRITPREGDVVEVEAQSLAALKETHPEIYAKVSPLFGNVRIGWGTLPDPRFKRPGPSGLGIPGRPGTSRPTPLTPQDAFRLGVWTGEVSDPLRVHLKLPRGVGVLVEDVVPGSFAAQIGLEPFDVIRTVQGEKIGSANDIRRVIATVASGEQVALDIIRKGEPLKLMRNR